MTLEQLSAAATQELLPCPFCGCGPSNDEHAQQVQFYREISAPNGYVWCEGCGAEGPWRKDRDEAIAAWNHRTGQLVAVQPDDATVERVARAICDTLKAQLERHAPEVLEHLEISPEYWSDVSTAAIAAMKVPKP